MNNKKESNNLNTKSFNKGKNYKENGKLDKIN
jgi:hypothetical protein